MVEALYIHPQSISYLVLVQYRLLIFIKDYGNNMIQHQERGYGISFEEVICI